MRTSDRGRGLDEVSEQLGKVNDNPYGENGGDLDENGNPIDKGEQADTTKKKREKRPLESYFFSDSVRAQLFTRWFVDPSANRIVIDNVDSLIGRFSVDYPFQKPDVGDAYLGNLGGTSVPLNFFRRESYTASSPLPDYARGYYIYMYTPTNVPFYNVKKPYTVLGYSTAGQKRYAEENLHITHAQNITPSTGFNVTYDNQGTKGVYTWQKSKVKNLSVAVSHTGKRYSAHAGYIYNMAYQRENGGVTEDWHIIDTTYESALNVPMKLSDAVNEIRNNSFYLVQAYGVPLARLSDDDFTMAGKPSFYVGHSVVWSRWSRHYTDTYSGTTYNLVDPLTNQITGQEHYYQNWYIDPASTRDTMAQRVLSNRVFVQLQPWDRDGIIGVIDGGVGMDNLMFYQFKLNQYLSGLQRVTDRTLYAYGRAEGKFRKYFDWNADLKYNVAGYASGDLNAGGKASLSLYVRNKPITLSGGFRFKRTSPSYWSDNYFSNHFAWSNSFAKENETRIEIKLDAPLFRAEAGLYQSVIGNRIYYDENSMPVQASEAVSVTGVYARKDFAIGGLHLNNRVMLQLSTNQLVVPVPTVAVNLSYFYQFWVVKGVLEAKVGLDGWWNTKYYAFAYNPALQVYYNQREKELGEYPAVNAFVSAKWKRMRINLQYQHLSEGMFGTRESFTVLHYPLNKRIFKVGISWNFYD